MSLFLTIKKLGFQTDPLPPLSQMSLYLYYLFFRDGFPKSESMVKGVTIKRRNLNIFNSV